MSADSPRVDARVAQTRELVIDAMRALFEEEGMAAVTHQRVAQRSGVARATVYRHWPRKIDLVSDAIATAEHPILRAGRGPLRAWLRREMRRTADDLARPESAQFIATIISLGADPTIAELVSALMKRTEQTLDDAFDDALSRGELRTRPDAAEAAAQLVGAMIFHQQIQKTKISDVFIGRLIDATIGTDEQ